MLTVNDLQDERFSLVQSNDEIEQLNKDYDQEYCYYFIEYDGDIAKTLYGSYGIRLSNRVYKVAYL